MATDQLRITSIRLDGGGIAIDVVHAAAIRADVVLGSPVAGSDGRYVDEHR
jgi:hypothetical protein